MSGKHVSTAGVLARLRPGDDLRLRRGWMIVGVVLALAAVVWSVVWVERTAQRDPAPKLAQPAAVFTGSPPILSSPAPASYPVSPPALPPALPSGWSPSGWSPSGRGGAPHTVTARPSVATSPPAKKPGGKVVATYAVGSSWDTGFIGSITVVNNTGAAVSPQISVHNAPADGVRVNQIWNGTASKNGDTVVFSARLEPGATVTIGFDATKNAGPRVRPASCTVAEGVCQVS